MTIPVFILGLQRSGTTWLGNLLASHPDIAVATHPRHRGVHESVFFSHFARAWDWTDSDDRATALRAFAASDYGQLIGAMSLPHASTIVRPADYFVAAMGSFAAQHAAWVEKSPHHTRLADEIARDIPAARFICVIRQTEGLIASRLHAYGRKAPFGAARQTAILRGAASSAAHVQFLLAFAGRMGPRAMVLQYEDLKQDTNGTMETLLRWLNLSRNVRLTSTFKANSSFESARERPAFTTAERRLIALGETIGRCTPASVVTRLPQRPIFPAWVWSDPRDSQGAALAPARRPAYE